MMNSERLEATLRGQAPTMTMVLRGELTSSGDGTVMAAYRQATTQDARSIIVDFSQVELMNSAGISQLIGVVTEAHKVNHGIIFVGLTPHYRKILTMMGLTRYAQVYDNLADAQKSLESGA